MAFFYTIETSDLMNQTPPLSADDIDAMADSMHTQTPEQLRHNLDILLASLPDDLRQQFLQHEADARARPVLGELTPASLHALAEDQREAALVAYVDTALRRDGDRVAALLRLPRALQVHYLSFVVEAETMNGGLHQFFWNPSGELAALVAPALVELGADDAAAVFAQALEVAHSEAASRDALRADGAWEAFVQSSGQSFLRTFDAAFVALAAGFPALRAALLRDKEAQFMPAAA
jgi:hypothetical protein